MHREVDATELDDVHLEESDDDLSEPAPVSGASADGPVALHDFAPAILGEANAPTPSSPSEGGTPAGEMPQS